MYRLIKSPLDRHYYLVEETADIKDKDICMCLDSTSVYYLTTEQLTKKTEQYIKENWYKVIASTKEIKNLYLLAISNCMFVNLVIHISNEAKKHASLIKDDNNISYNSFLSGYTNCVTAMLNENVDITNLYKSLDCDYYVTVEKNEKENKILINNFLYIENTNT